jgi:hypothetical protein
MVLCAGQQRTAGQRQGPAARRDGRAQETMASSALLWVDLKTLSIILRMVYH